MQRVLIVVLLGALLTGFTGSKPSLRPQRTAAFGHQNPAYPRNLPSAYQYPWYGLTDIEIKYAIGTKLDILRSCYWEVLMVKPGIRGTVGVSFRISGATGLVEALTFSKEASSEPLLRLCTARAVRSMVFPKPRGGYPVVVNYPFVFTPNM